MAELILLLLFLLLLLSVVAVAVVVAWCSLLVMILADEFEEGFGSNVGPSRHEWFELDTSDWVVV
jgi:hypothetical protein